MRTREGLRWPPLVSNQHGEFSISRRGRLRRGVTASFKRDSALKKRELEARSTLSDRPLLLVNLPTVAWTSQSDLPTLIVWRQSESTLLFPFRCDARVGFAATSGTGAHGATRSIPRGKIHFMSCKKKHAIEVWMRCVFSALKWPQKHTKTTPLYIRRRYIFICVYITTNTLVHWG